jgi:hypothetical protein
MNRQCGAMGASKSEGTSVPTIYLHPITLGLKYRLKVIKEYEKGVVFPGGTLCLLFTRLVSSYSVCHVFCTVHT